jgi:chitinase
LNGAVLTSPVRVSLTWSASTDNVGVAGYRVDRGGVQIGTTTTASYVDSTVSGSTSYTYVVRAYDAAGNLSAASDARTVTTPPASDTAPPTVPEYLRVTQVTKTSITVAWSPSSDNVGVTRYGAYRNGVFKGTVTTLGVQHIYLTCGTSYSLGVDARDAAGNRSAQATITARTANC